ncbi:hypothetical protein [Burkholderia sp. MSMB617WGS]|uniref:hypothetical protein n=1 Tax=Burkholderia sp. MSMB617WGS TaxID=1637831 RepID=UPI0011AE80B9|nr:hypothetical protein [Burkholderia sp. MSMB617WGS]
MPTRLLQAVRDLRAVRRPLRRQRLFLIGAGDHRVARRTAFLTRRRMPRRAAVSSSRKGRDSFAGLFAEPPSFFI